MNVKPMDRRRFLLASAATAASLRSFGQTAAAPVVISVAPAAHAFTVPAGFIGLSYETQQLCDPTFFSASNTGLIRLFRELAPTGVLRLGGNTSDVGYWKATPTSPKPEIHVLNTGEGEPNADLAYAIGPEGVRNLRGFLDATGWNCAYGINLGTNTPARAAEEAAFVAPTLGARLLFFQIGNEPDLFDRHLRDKTTWSADKFFDEWLAAANAIRARVPGAKFSLPDTSGSPKWYATIARRLTALPPADRPTLAALSHHYYFGGPPANPAVNVDRLLQPAPHVLELAQGITSAQGTLEAAGIRVPIRMTEGNTCYRGGKPGVSDVMAAALWAADYALLLASLGYAGLNLHGGSGQMVANSLGGTLPGERLLADPNAPHPRPFYTPINAEAGHYAPEPVFWGLKFAGQFAGATMLATNFQPGTVNATCYAASLPSGATLLAVINKDKSLPLPVALPGYKLVSTLTAASLTSSSVSFAPAAKGVNSGSVAAGSAALYRRG